MAFIDVAMMEPPHGESGAPSLRLDARAVHAFLACLIGVGAELAGLVHTLFAPCHTRCLIEMWGAWK